jgi:hypothetical protein
LAVAADCFVCGLCCCHAPIIRIRVEFTIAKTAIRESSFPNRRKVRIGVELGPKKSFGFCRNRIYAGRPGRRLTF